MNLTVQDVKLFSQDPVNLRLYEAYLELKKEAVRLRKEIDAIYKPIFEEYEFFDDHTGKKLTYKTRAYACTQEALYNEYHRRCVQAIKDAGYQVPEGYCPALMAENKVLDHESLILDALCGILRVKKSQLYGDKRQQALNLFTNLFSQLSTTK